MPTMSNRELRKQKEKHPCDDSAVDRGNLTTPTTESQPSEDVEKNTTFVVYPNDSLPLRRLSVPQQRNQTPYADNNQFSATVSHTILFHRSNFNVATLYNTIHSVYQTLSSKLFTLVLQTIIRSRASSSIFRHQVVFPSPPEVEVCEPEPALCD
jgi:hypothetical protein